MSKTKNSHYKFLKYVLIFLTFTAFIFIFTFLLNPIFFIKDIESRITKLIESESGMELNYKNFSGNFYKGFYLESPSLYLNSKIIGDVEKIGVYPGIISSVFSDKLHLKELILYNGILNLDNFSIKSTGNKSKIHINLLELEDISIQIDSKRYKINSKLEINIGNHHEINFYSGLCELPFWPFNIELYNGSFKIYPAHYLIEDLKMNSNYGQMEINGEFKKNNILNSFANLRLNNLKLDYYIDEQLDIENLNIMFESISSDSSIAILNGNAKFQNLYIDNYQIDLGLTKDKVYINSSNITYDTAEIQLNGMYDLKSNIIELNSNLININLPIEIENNLNGLMNIYGTVYKDSLIVDLTLEKSSVNNIYLNEINGKLLYKNNTFTNLEKINTFNEFVKVKLDRIKFNLNDKSFFSIGDIGFKNYNFTTEYLGKKFNLNLNGKFTGELSKNDELYSIFGDGDFDKIKINDNLIRSINSKFSFSNKDNDLYLSVKGNSNLNYTIYDNYLKLDSLSFSLVKNNEIIQIKYLNGFNSNFPKLFVKDLEILSDKIISKEIFINYNEVDILTDEILIFKRDDSWNLEYHPVSLNNDNIYIKSIFNDTQSFEFKAYSNQINFSSINSIIGAPQRLIGQFSGDFNYSKSPYKFDISTQAKMYNGKFDEMLFDSLLYNINWNENKVSYKEISFVKDKQLLNISGEHFPSQDSKEKYRYGDIVLIGNASNFELNNLNNYIPISMDISGKYTGDFKLNGTPELPIIHIDFNIKNPQFDLIKGEFLSGKIFYENQISKLNELYLKTQNGSYNGGGYVPINLNLFGSKSDFYTNPKLNFSFKGQTTEFEFLTPYFEIIDSINGQINLNLNISGSLFEPKRNGSIEIKQTQLNLMPLENTIYGINGYAEIKNNILNIDYLNGLTGNQFKSNRIETISNLFKIFFSNSNKKYDNLINVGGDIELANFFNPEFDLIISSNNLYLSSIDKNYRGNAVTKFNIFGKDTIFINGEFKPIANKFTFLMEFDEKDDLSKEKISKGKVLSYDIQIPLDNGVKIENSQMDGLIDGDINITAIGNEPFTFSGNINVVDGSFYFNGNTIDQISGNILLDPAELEPVIDFAGITNVAGKDIELSLSGKMDNPNLSLESISDPELTQDDLLYLLVFTPDSSSNTDGLIGTEEVGNLITNYVENTLERNIVRNSLLDKFQFNTQGGTLLSGFENSHLNLYLGKNISPNLYLNLKSDLNSEHSTFQYEVGYRLSRNMSIIGRIDEKQLYHLTYRFKYKY